MIGNNRLWTSLALAGLGLGAGFVLGLRAAPDLREPSHYVAIRGHFVSEQAARFGRADTLIIGDSLSEEADLFGVCGRTFNAGVAGARLRDAVGTTPALLDAISPETLVVSLGTNDFLGKPPADFRRRYEEFVRSLGDRRLILVGIAISQEGNAIIRATAGKTGARFVPPVRQLGPDGVHHTAEGSRSYRRSLAEACEELDPARPTVQAARRPATT